MSDDEDEDVPHLDLYNFTEPSADNSKYVLTSPRSLEACSRYKIKPLELLPKTQGEFTAEFFPRAKHADIELLHQEFERERLRKLRLCRDEYERIIEEEGLKMNERNNNEVSKSWADVFSATQGNSGSGDDFHSEKPSILTYVASSKRLKNSGRSDSPLSYERNGVDNDSDYAEDGHHDDVMKPSQSDTVISWKTKMRSAPSPKMSSSTPSSPRMQRASWRKPSSAKTSKSLSFSEISSSLPKHMQNAMANMSLKDKKLLHHMIDRSNGELLEKDLQFVAEVERLNGVKASEHIDRVNRKQKEIQLNAKIWEKKKRMEKVQQSRMQQDNDVHSMHEEEIHSKNARWQNNYNEQYQDKINKLALKRIEKENRKKIQEENIKRIELERRLSGDITYLDTVLRSPSAIRRSEWKGTEHDCAQEQARLEHTSRVNAIEQRELQAQEYFHRRMKQREAEMARAKSKQQERRHQQSDHMQKMQEDLHVWQKELDAYHKVNQERASLAAMQTVMGKKERASQKRREREEDQALLKARLEAEEEMHKEELRAQCNLKLQRADLVCKDREKYAESSREAARASRAVREKLKEQTYKSSFDRMAEEAERIARIERMGNRSNAKNQSSVGSILG